MASVCRLCGSSVAYSHHGVEKASQERLASRISALLDITLNDDDGLLNLRCAKCNLFLHICTVSVTIFSTSGNSAWFQILHSYTLLLKSPVLMCFCF